MNSKRDNSGFTFLEVMVALAIMSIALVTVIVAQSQSIALVEKGKSQFTGPEISGKKIGNLELFELQYPSNYDSDRIRLKLTKK